MERILLRRGAFRTVLLLVSSLVIFVTGAVFLGGCASPFMFRSQTPEDEISQQEEALDAWLIGDFTSPWGLNYSHAETIALVTELKNSGSDPPPSPQRDAIIGEMLARNVSKPNQVLASPETSMVVVRAFLPPAAQKGDIVDIEIRTMPGSKTSSLRNGWLMPCRLKEMLVLSTVSRSGHEVVKARGRVLVDAEFDRATSGDTDGAKSERKVLQTRGRILGGGEVITPRRLGLEISTDHNSVKTSAALGAAINQRFFTYENGIKKPAAEPKSDKFIELAIHPRYKNNISRYLRVIGGIAVGESLVQRAERLTSLEKQLLDPASAALAAIRLEAIGDEGADVLKKGLQSRDVEVRFYAAEALAYLNEGNAVPVLAEAAQNEPAFRWHALTALTVIDDLDAYDALSSLLHTASVETRYGAFRALRVRNEKDPAVRDQTINEEFHYHLVRSKAEPMVHLTRSQRAELALFGVDQHISSPGVIFAGPQIMVKGINGETIKVSRFSSGAGAAHEMCSTRLDDVVRAIVKMGGKYSDLVEFLMEAHAKHYLQSRLVIDAVPQPGKYYEVKQDEELHPIGGSEPPQSGELTSSIGKSSVSRAASPLPELFQRRTGEGGKSPVEWEKEPEFVEQSATTPKRSEGFLGKIKEWFEK